MLPPSPILAVFLCAPPTLTTTRSVITRFDTDSLYQIFIQDGNTIEVPVPNVEGIPSDNNTINPEFCEAAPIAFDDRDRFGEVGGFSVLNDALAMPMVLVMSIWSDVSPPLASPALAPKNLFPTAAFQAHLP